MYKKIKDIATNFLNSSGSRQVQWIISKDEFLTAYTTRRKKE